MRCNSTASSEIEAENETPTSDGEGYASWDFYVLDDPEVQRFCFDEPLEQHHHLPLPSEGLNAAGAKSRIAHDPAERRRRLPRAFERLEKHLERWKPENLTGWRLKQVEWFRGGPIGEATSSPKKGRGRPRRS